MSAATGPGPSRPDPLLHDAASYLEDTAPARGGRNSRPLAVPALVSTYVSSTRTGFGVAAAAAAALAGAALWFGLEQLTQPSGSMVLAVVGFVVAGGLLAAAARLGWRVLRSGAALVRAMRRWHAVAPEVPVRGAELLTAGAGPLRLVLAGVGLLAAGGAAALAFLLGSAAAWLGFGLAAIALLLAAATAAYGWWQMRGLLRASSPHPDGEAFAPAPYTAAAPGAAGPGGGPNPPGEPHQVAPPPAWQPPPSTWEQPPAPSQPWLPAPGVTLPPNPADTWGPSGAAPGWSPPPPVEPEPDFHETRLEAAAVVETTLAGRAGNGIVVLLEDGGRLSQSILTLIGRDPEPRTGDPEVEPVVVVHPTVSKTHAAFAVTATEVHVTDRASTNGTVVVGPDGARSPLEPWVESRVLPGSVVLLGDYRIRVLHE